MAKLWTYPAVITACIGLLAASVLVAVWTLVYGGSYVWDDNRRHPRLLNLPIKFNFHPTLMLAGLVTVDGFALLTYRISASRRLPIQIVHVVLHSIGAALAAFGLLIVYEAKETSYPYEVKHFYSLHSWMGIATVVMFVLQYTIGFFTNILLLCCDKTTYNCRLNYIPLHRSAGLITFVLACITALLGVVQVGHQALRDHSPLESKNRITNREAIVLNGIGVAIALSMMTIFILVKSKASGKSRL